MEHTKPEMKESYGNYIGGEWIASESGKTFESRNPSNTTELIGEFAQQALARPPVVVGYTGVVADEDRGRFLRAGAVEIVQKPLDRAAFEGALRRAIAKARR